MRPFDFETLRGRLFMMVVVDCLYMLVCFAVFLGSHRTQAHTRSKAQISDCKANANRAPRAMQGLFPTRHADSITRKCFCQGCPRDIGSHRILRPAPLPAQQESLRLRAAGVGEDGAPVVRRGLRTRRSEQ